jgi:CheY-like chemotaxis protein
MTEEKTKSPFKILFVDDEDNARKYFEKGLKHQFNIMLAASVDEAQKIINEHHKDIAVVITDQRMPGGNGVILLRFLREQYPRIIRLLTTAYSDLTEAIEAVNSGEILRYIQKPWDFSMLKHELNQALELFELRLERNHFLHEKMMVKRKMVKVDRVKSLLVFAKAFESLRFCENSAQNFIKTFAIEEAEQDEQNQGFEEFDLGNNEIVETKFFLELIKKIQNEIPHNTNYDFDSKLDIAKLEALVEKEKNNSPLSFEKRFSTEIDGKINEKFFGEIIGKLLQIATLAHSQKASLAVEKSGNELVINLNSTGISLPKNSNIFSANTQKPFSDFHLDLLIIYLLAGHHGGKVETTIENQNLICTLKLPLDPSHATIVSKSEDLENTILSVMIA